LARRVLFLCSSLPSAKPERRQLLAAGLIRMRLANHREGDARLGESLCRDAARWLVRQRVPPAEGRPLVERLRGLLGCLGTWVWWGFTDRDEADRAAFDLTDMEQAWMSIRQDAEELLATYDLPPLNAAWPATPAVGSIQEKIPESPAPPAAEPVPDPDHPPAWIADLFKRSQHSLLRALWARDFVGQRELIAELGHLQSHDPIEAIRKAVTRTNRKLCNHRSRIGQGWTISQRTRDGLMEWRLTPTG
jgi:hypothetical protein